MMIPYGLILNALVIAVLILAFLSAEGRERLWLAGIALLVFSAPSLLPASTGFWVGHIGKALLGLGCLVFIKFKGML